MNAVVPLNVAALRVNQNDVTNIVNQFKGATGAFRSMPWVRGGNLNLSSTGDQVVEPLEAGFSPQNPLGAGIHLHWELPDAFRRGTQPPELGAAIVFPPAPDRYLVIRYLSLWNGSAWDAPQSNAWIVESDFVSPTLTPDSTGVIRPAISVPLPSSPGFGVQPYMFMGRVVDYASWDPSSEPPSNYLPSFNGPDGHALYLNSTGFVGASFSSYYPDCCSVFGFWDHFKDVPAVYQAIANDTPVQFKVSYQVIGWLQDAASDPLSGVAATVTQQYDAYVAQCVAQKVPVVTTPADVFGTLMTSSLRWSVHTEDVPYTLNPDKTLATLTVPEQTMCSGLVQEIVWNMLQAPGTTSFLSTGNPQSPAIWLDTVELAVGNTPIEALSAILKKDVSGSTNDPNLLTNYEYLLDALQLGLLQGLESQPNKLISLDEILHERAFNQTTGGFVWTVEPIGASEDPNTEITLPLDLAEQLSLLNNAQKKYDQARAAVEQMRRQLFFDWFRYIKIFVGETTDPNVGINALSQFLLTNGPNCELASVVAAGGNAGLLLYQQDPGGSIIGLQPPASTTSLAGLVYQKFQAMTAALPHNWQIRALPAPAFFQPTDPVLLMEGSMLEPVRRNGTSVQIAVRLSTELFSELTVATGSATFTVGATALAGLPAITHVTPMQADMQSAVNEAGLLLPALASLVGDALRAEGGTGNPAVTDEDGFIAELQTAQGGASPLEGGPGAGLFAAVRTSPFITAPNPAESVSTPVALTFTFTNSGAIGWPPDPVGWNAQQALTAFGPQRFDPFLPVSLVWTINYFPLVLNADGDYSDDDLTGNFQLDSDAVDYQYLLSGGSAPFATQFIQYDSAVVLSKKPVFSLTAQIDNFIQNYPSDPADPELTKIRDAYILRQFLSQAMSGFSSEQILLAYVPPVTVEDLVTRPGMDLVTAQINTAAGATAGDNWYDFTFNTQEPIATGPLAQANFGPLRSGFLEIAAAEIVDVFGQRMDLNTASSNPDGSLQTTTAVTLQPPPYDPAHAQLVFLPPRLLTPTRLWFRWLSAMHNNDVSGVTTDFVEMNNHPATSPVCGWILPNHLDNSLFFYDANGAPIGSFGIEHGALVYRTRPGNAANPGDSLQVDIGPKGSPTVNPHVATFLWYVDGQTAGFLIDLMATFLNADGYINPTSYAEDPALAVLIGRPLVLTRAVLGLETLGNVLPVSQADTSADAPFPFAVNNGLFDYTARQDACTASLGDVQFPIRLGNLTDLDDGLVGYLIEGSETNPYGILYSPAAPANWMNGVQQPTATTLETTLNATPFTLTLIVDPRASVHATTGILPVNELAIPPDQYSATMQNLAMTFFTAPVLEAQTGLVVALPQETGFDWQWIAPAPATPVDLAANAADDAARYGYSPQTVLEGWLRLTPAPLPPEGTE